MPTKSVTTLASEATSLIRKYLADPSTEKLRLLAPVIVELRKNFHLKDNTTDWGGRSPDYRKVIGEVYERAGVPKDRLNNLQTALRYHTGNLIRDEAPAHVLEELGLGGAKPTERAANHRKAFRAMQESAAPRQDIPKIAVYAQALLEYMDDDAIAELSPEEIEASRIALEYIQSRSAELLVRLRDAKRRKPVTESPTSRKTKPKLKGV